MITLLTRLTLCFALFSSVSSAAYNPAMCILIKQEMQQYSNNKTSAKYRSAARDYNKNCNIPKDVQKQSVAQPKNVIITQPQPKIIEPASTKKVEQPKNIIHEAAAPVTAPAITTPNEPAVNSSSASNIQKPEPNTPKIVQPVKINSAPTINTPPTEKPTSTIKPAPLYPPAQLPSSQSPNSLLLPGLILAIIILIIVMVLLRLRRAKMQKSAELCNTAMPVSSAEPTKIEPQPVASAGPITTNKANAEDESALTPRSFEETTKLTAHNNSNLNTHNTQNTNEKPPITKPIEQTYNDKTTPELEKNSTAPVISEKQTPTKTLADALTEKKPPDVGFDAISDLSKPEKNTSKPVIAAQEPINSTNENTSPHNQKIKRPTSEHTFKEPKVRTFDPNAPLPGVKVATKEKPAVPKTAKSDSSNPFANLSLDPSWDPNSAEKPKIEEKKRTPKSQALIDAQARAKNMDTK